VADHPLPEPAGDHRFHCAADRAGGLPSHAEAGNDTEHFHAVASRLLLAALVFLAPAMAGDLFVVIAKVSGSSALAGWTAGPMLLAFYGLWFGVSGMRRAK